MKREEAIIRAAYRERLRSLLVLLFASHDSTGPAEFFARHLMSARARRDAALAIIRGKHKETPDMATTLNKPPHDAEGKITLASAKESLDYMEQQFRSGAEVLIGVHRVDLADGTHQTIIHHKAA